MNTKTSWGLLLLVLLAALFAPLVPNDVSLECGDALADCDNVPAYVSVYSKYFGK